MSDQVQLLTYEEACKTIFAPWFSGKDLAAGVRVATPREAAARALLAALNTNGERGGIRVLVQTTEAKRSVRNFLDAFLLDEPRLKKMVKRMTPDVIHLHGGITVTIDTNDVRLVRDAIATVVLDPTADKPLATLWLNTGETPEAACTRAGIDPALVARVRFVRWLTEDEQAAV